MLISRSGRECSLSWALGNISHRYGTVAEKSCSRHNKTQKIRLLQQGLPYCPEPAPSWSGPWCRPYKTLKLKLEICQIQVGERFGVDTVLPCPLGAFWIWQTSPPEADLKRSSSSDSFLPDLFPQGFSMWGGRGTTLRRTHEDCWSRTTGCFRSWLLLHVLIVGMKQQ